MELPRAISHLQELSPKLFKEKDIKICSYLFKCATNKSLDTLSIRKCANFLKVSPSALVRFSKKIGFNGFNELKEYIANITNPTNIKLSFKLKEINDYCQLTYYLSQKSINLNEKSFNDLANLLTNNHKILVYGDGISNLVARYLTIQLGKIGIMIDTVDLISSVEREIADLKNSDGIILVSQSGESPNIIRKANQAKDLQLPVVSLTNHQPNTLATLSDINIKIVANSNHTPILNTINYNSVIFFLIDFFIQKLLSRNK
ncbi:MAG: MurR/RpiR family transcriptional regulator [Alphaproteobacteria bacterium]|jgi:DNA-binding MurR/RpiR family transcriptional regulator|nr:MurR/RpiR family transcriptional regulator [Alphaproteobacteria bacterium]